MKGKTEIIDITRKVIENVSNLDDWIDGHLEEIKDYTDTAGDIIGPIKSFGSIVKFVKSRKFKSFLKSYAKEVKQNQGVVSEKYSSQLSKYLERPSNLNMIYESIDSSIQANSIFSAQCIGYIAGMQMTNLIEANNKVMILINAFKNLNDFELYSSAKIISKIEDFTKPQSIKQLKVTSIKTVSKYTIQKLKNLQIIESLPLPGMMLGTYNESDIFQISDITEEFYEIILDSGVFKEMEKHFTYR